MRCTIELCSKLITPSRLFLKDITIIDHKIHSEWADNNYGLIVTKGHNIIINSDYGMINKIFQYLRMVIIIITGFYMKMNI